MEKQKKTPALRFPEFQGEWELLKFEKFFVERNESLNQEYPLYSLTIYEGIVPKTERYERSFLVNEIDAAYKVMHPDDFAYNPMNLRFGALARLKEDIKVSVSKYYNIFFCNDNANSIFFENYLTCYNLIQYYNKMATGSLLEKKRVHYLDFIQFKKHLPTLPEQTRIASFLTSIDDKLIQLKKKKTLLEQYKKGVMQKIFSQELRFKPDLSEVEGDENGEEFPVWKKNKFGEIYQFYSTNSLSRENLSYTVGEVRNIHYGDIHTKFSSLFVLEEEEVPYLNSNIDTSKINKNNFCKEGDLIIADASEDYSDIGKTIEITGTNNEKIVAGLHTIHARPDLSMMHVGFGGHLMKSSAVKYQIKIIAQGIKVLSISTGRLADIEIVIPCLAEQTKIANFLSAIDEKINHTQTQIEKTETWKKGLLQQMLV